MGIFSLITMLRPWCWSNTSKDPKLKINFFVVSLFFERELYIYIYIYSCKNPGYNRFYKEIFIFGVHNKKTCILCPLKVCENNFVAMSLVTKMLEV